MISCVSIRTFSLVLLSFLLNHINTKYRSILRCDSGSTGNMTVTDLRLFSSRGYSLHDGVTRYVGKAAYYWSPVSIFTCRGVIRRTSRRSSVCRLSSVCCLSVKFVQPAQRCEPFGNIFAPSNSLQTSAVYDVRPTGPY